MYKHNRCDIGDKERLVADSSAGLVPKNYLPYFPGLFLNPQKNLPFIFYFVNISIYKVVVMVSLQFKMHIVQLFELYGVKNGNSIKQGKFWIKLL